MSKYLEMFPVSLCEIGKRAKTSQTYIPSDIAVTVAKPVTSKNHHSNDCSNYIDLGLLCYK